MSISARRLWPLLALLPGCPGSLENPEQFLGDCPDPPTEIFPEKCARTECHSSMTKAGEMDLEAPGVEARVVGVVSPGCVGFSCEGDLIADPGNPEASIMYRKITEDPPPVGTRMPQTGSTLSSYERGCVLEWIEAQSPGGGDGDADADADADSDADADADGDVDGGA